MKKLLLFLLLLPIVYANQTLEISETTDFNGREVKIEGIQESKVIISVDGVKNIVSLNELKVINGIKIKVTNIFFANELSTTSLNLDLAYTCGDNSCDLGETPLNCCQDCACTSSREVCVESSCMIPECYSDQGCNDNDPLTTDTCLNSECEYKKVKCEEDLDCDDLNPDTDDTCRNSRCNNLLNYTCKESIECDDNNPCTIDICLDRDCKNERINDCEYTPEPLELPEEITQEASPKKEGILVKLFTWLGNIFK